MMMQATPAIPSVGQKHLWIFETKDLWYSDLLSSDIDPEPFYVDFAFRIMLSIVLIIIISSYSAINITRPHLYLRELTDIG